MGIPMDEIHMPTVPSGDVTGGYSNGIRKDEMSFDQLVAEKERLEEELKALSAVLDSVHTRSVLLE
jgi:26S proteasome regulatory subunit N4